MDQKTLIKTNPRLYIVWGRGGGVAVGWGGGGGLGGNRFPFSCISTMGKLLITSQGSTSERILEYCAWADKISKY